MFIVIIAIAVEYVSPHDSKLIELIITLAILVIPLIASTLIIAYLGYSYTMWLFRKIAHQGRGWTWQTQRRIQEERNWIDFSHDEQILANRDENVEYWVDYECQI